MVTERQRQTKRKIVRPTSDILTYYIQILRKTVIYNIQIDKQAYIL